jgi:hypothetical protein
LTYLDKDVFLGRREIELVFVLVQARVDDVAKEILVTLEKRESDATKRHKIRNQ